MKLELISIERANEILSEIKNWKAESVSARVNFPHTTGTYAVAEYLANKEGLTFYSSFVSSKGEEPLDEVYKMCHETFEECNPVSGRQQIDHEQRGPSKIDGEDVYQ